MGRLDLNSRLDFLIRIEPRLVQGDRQDDRLLESSRTQLHPVLQCRRQGGSEMFEARSQGGLCQAGSHLHQVCKVGGRQTSRQEGIMFLGLCTTSGILKEVERRKLRPKSLPTTLMR